MTTSAESSVNMLHHIVVEAAFLHTRPNCYFVGPYAQRVSFASQQIRALDLVTGLLSLKTELLKRKGASVAVVGAGLAGMMAAAALKSQHVKVHIFEAESDILSKHEAARHRLVHPTIGRWPFEKLEHTSHLPIFNWCAAKCDKVMAKIKNEWERYLHPMIYSGDDNLSDFVIIPNTKVRKLEKGHDVDGDRRVRLLLDQKRPGITDDKKWCKEHYDLVIVATGYGLENLNARKSANNYWTDDELDNDVNTESEKEEYDDKRTFYVTGCGDGGLIDFCRIIHADFHGGWLAIMVANALEGTAIAKALANAELDALMWARSLLSLEETKKNPSAEDTEQNKTRSDEMVSARLYPIYQKMAQKLRSGGDPEDDPEDREIYTKVNAVLTRSLSGRYLQGHAFLVSALPHPFRPFAAPIHKLLIAHALECDKDIYLQGKYVLEDNRRERLNLFFDSDKYAGKANIIIPRHGSEPQDTSFLEPPEIQSLKLRQLMLADWIPSKSGRDFSFFEGYPNPGTDRGTSLQFQLEHIVELFTALDDRFTVRATEMGDLLLQRLSHRQRPTNTCACAIGFDEKIGLTLPKRIFGTFEVVNRLAEGDMVDTLPAYET